jgi:predicted kinase
MFDTESEDAFGPSCELILIRGLPGSGKSKFANMLVEYCSEEEAVVLEADQFFLDEKGAYVFDPTKLSAAHEWCLERAVEAMKKGQRVVVANTFTQLWMMRPYIDWAKELGIPFTVISLYDGGKSDETLASRNGHGVPLRTIAMMRAAWEL